jgi:predicted DNA-binding protein YlxM (UPF0122 family)
MANHFSARGKGSPLLEFEWSISDPETVEVLCECKDQKELNTKEVQYIEALKPPLNTLKGGGACYGINHPRAKHDEDTYKEIIRLYIETDASYQDISDITEVDYHTVRDIVLRRTHARLDKYYDPKLLKAAYDKRHPSVVLYDRNNVKYEAATQKELADILKVSPQVVSQALARDGTYSLNGVVRTPHERIIIVSPEGEEFDTNVFLARILLEEAGLSKYQKIQLLTKKKSSGGWRVKKI